MKGKHEGKEGSTPPKSSGVCVSPQRPYVTHPLSNCQHTAIWATLLSFVFCATKYYNCQASHGYEASADGNTTAVPAHCNARTPNDSLEGTLPRIAPDAPGVAAGAEEPGAAGRQAAQSKTAVASPSQGLRAQQHRDAGQQRPQMSRPCPSWLLRLRLSAPCP